MTFGHVLHGLLGLIVSITGFLIPCRNSYKALEAQYDWERHLTYWVVFGSFCASEHFLFFLVSRIPLWTLLKLAFVVWLQLPQTQVCLNGPFFT